MHGLDNPPSRAKFTYSEAFKVMRYKCEGCGYLEFIWNSRDGITPFCVLSRCCDKQYSQHIDSMSDYYCAELPPEASRAFINMTLEKATEKAQIFWTLRGKELMSQHEHLRKRGKDALMQSKIKDIYSNFGEGTSPDTVTRKEFLTANNIMALAAKAGTETDTGRR